MGSWGFGWAIVGNSGLLRWMMDGMVGLMVVFAIGCGKLILLLLLLLLFLFGSRLDSGGSEKNRR